MHERFARILEAGAVHTLQQSITAVIEKGKARAGALSDLRTRITTLEEDVAQLKAKRKGKVG
jgi:polyhydroxyalkanoate synthesis regulator phasin